MLFKNDPYKHGYYEVNGYRTFSKLEAIELSHRTGHWPNWIFNDDIFSSLDCTKEPDIDLYELYKARCRQIRDAYDYVVLFYSGGSDSVNVLTAWIDADCKIDEIASVWVGSQDPEFYMNQEIARVVIPGVQRLKDKGYEFTFRLIDNTKLTFDFINNVQSDYGYYVNNHFSPNNIIKSQFRERIKDYVDIINSGKSMCFVWGFEKPQIYPDKDNRHYLQFFDVMDNCISPYSQQRVKQGWYDELFYWTPEMPEIILKEAHTLLNFAKTCDMPEFYQSKHNQYGYNKRINKFITSTAAKKILYPKWDPNTFCNGKTSGFIFSERDEWFWKGNADGVDMMQTLCKNYFKSVGKFWINDGENISSGIKGHASPKYYLE